MRVRKLGHACLLVEAGAAESVVRVLLDPGVWSTGFAEVRGLAAVLVTHQHADHVDVDRLGPLLAANPDATVLTDPATAAQLAEHDIPARVVDGGDRVDVGGLTVDVVGHQHAEIHADIPRIPNVGFLVGGTLFHPGDALTVPAVPVPVLALPTAAPWTKSGEVVDYLRAVAPRVAIPIHERTLAFPEMEYTRYRQLAPAGTEVVVLDGDEPWEFDAGR